MPSWLSHTNPNTEEAMAEHLSFPTELRLAHPDGYLSCNGWGIQFAALQVQFDRWLEVGESRWRCYSTAYQASVVENGRVVAHMVKDFHTGGSLRWLDHDAFARFRQAAESWYLAHASEKQLAGDQDDDDQDDEDGDSDFDFDEDLEDLELELEDLKNNEPGAVPRFLAFLVQNNQAYFATQNTYTYHLSTMVHHGPYHGPLGGV